MCSTLLGWLGLNTIFWCSFIYNAQTLIAGVLAILAAVITVWATLRSAKINAEATLKSAAMMMNHSARQIAKEDADNRARLAEARGSAATEMRGRLIALKGTIDPNRRPTGGAGGMFQGRAAEMFPGIDGVKLAASLDQARLVGGIIQKEYIELAGWVDEVLANQEIRNQRDQFILQGMRMRERAEELIRALDNLAMI